MAAAPMPVKLWYHVIPIALTFTAFLLLLFTLLSPTPIFHTQVSLMFLQDLPAGAKTGVASLTSRFVAEDMRIPGRVMPTVMRRALQFVQVRAAQDQQPTNLWIGFLGACTRSPSAALNCTDPQIAASFSSSFDRINLSQDEQTVLPTGLEMFSSSIVASIVFVFLSLVFLLAASLPYHVKKANSTTDFFHANHRHIAKVGCLFGLVSLGVGLIATVSLRIQLGNAVTAFNVINGASKLQANLGTAFNQLWAALIINLIACLTAVTLVGRDDLAM